MAKKSRPPRSGSWRIGTWEILPDWRPEKLKNRRTGFVRSRASVGLTYAQRKALEKAKLTSQLSMSEIIRRCLSAGGIHSEPTPAALKESGKAKTQAARQPAMVW